MLVLLLYPPYLLLNLLSEISPFPVQYLLTISHIPPAHTHQFVELKGSVFRKLTKSNLFQIACVDVRERFHYIVWLTIIVCRNMSDSGWDTCEFVLI